MYNTNLDGEKSNLLNSRFLVYGCHSNIDVSKILINPEEIQYKANNWCEFDMYQ